MVPMNKMILHTPMRFTIGRYRLIFLFFAAVVLSGTGCKKNSSIDLKPSLNSANDNVIVHRTFIYVFDMILRASLDSALQVNHYAVIDSASISFNPAAKTYAFQYQGSACKDSVIRSGTFVMKLDTGFFVTGAIASVRFINYFEDGRWVKAIDTIRNMGITTGGKINFQSSIDSVLITKDSGRVIQWKARLSHLVEPGIIWSGAGNARVLVEGTGSGVSSKGFRFTSAFTKQANDDLNCPWMHDGTILLSTPGAQITTGAIRFIPQPACNDSVFYDFDGMVYNWRIERDHLSE